jgi:L-amino acid N-acyltransferase YncA
MTSSSSFSVRSFTASDLEGVHAIQSQQFRQPYSTFSSDATTSAQLGDSIELFTSLGYPCLVAVGGSSQVLGYGMAFPFQAGNPHLQAPTAQVTIDCDKSVAGDGVVEQKILEALKVALRAQGDVKRVATIALVRGGERKSALQAAAVTELYRREVESSGGSKMEFDDELVLEFEEL